MKNPLKTVQEKIKAGIAKLKPSPEGKAKILSRSGLTLLAGVPVAVGVIVLGPATATVAAGATALGLLGVGFGLLQEGDNVKYQIAMKKLADAKPALPQTEAAPAPKAEAAPVAAKPAAEFAAVAEKKAEEQAPVAAPAAIPAAKPENAPKP